jgi:toxin ParE1/3/4
MGPRRRQVVWTEGALDELDAALEFVASESRQGALHLLDNVLSSVESLSTLAERGRVVPERQDLSVREIFVGDHRLLYLVADSDVVILGLLHQRRDFERWGGLEK